VYPRKMLQIVSGHRTSDIGQGFFNIKGSIKAIPYPNTLNKREKNLILHYSILCPFLNRQEL